MRLFVLIRAVLSTARGEPLRVRARGLVSRPVVGRSAAGWTEGQGGLRGAGATRSRRERPARARGSSPTRNPCLRLSLGHHSSVPCGFPRLRPVPRPLPPLCPRIARFVLASRAPQRLSRSDFRSPSPSPWSFPSTPKALWCAFWRRCARPSRAARVHDTARAIAPAPPHASSAPSPPPPRRVPLRSLHRPA